MPYGPENFSAVTRHPYLLIDINTATPRLESTQLKSVCEKLKQLPCPVIGITGRNRSALPLTLLSSLDVILTSEKEASSIVKNILNAPLAAMILVQLLRHNETTNIHQGLFAESIAYATLQGGVEFQNFITQRRASKNISSKTADKQRTTMTEPPVITKRHNDELLLTLNRPERNNAYSILMRDQLFEGLQLLAEDLSIKRAIIRGAGNCFCVGGDLDEFGLFRDTATAHAIRSTRNVGKLISELADRIECHVHRACIGSGIELPAFCERIVATEKTMFQLPEITMGLIPGAGGTVSILRRIGRQRTAFLALSAKKINSRKALEWGLIDAIEPAP